MPQHYLNRINGIKGNKNIIANYINSLSIFNNYLLNKHTKLTHCICIKTIINLIQIIKKIKQM
jgi:hypothetical protein